jgi:hypothetical protein
VSCPESTHHALCAHNWHTEGTLADAYEKSRFRRRRAAEKVGRIPRRRRAERDFERLDRIVDPLCSLLPDEAFLIQSGNLVALVDNEDSPRKLIAKSKLAPIVSSGDVNARVVIGRLHLDCGSIASRNDETEAMLDGSDALCDCQLLNAFVNAPYGRHCAPSFMQDVLACTPRSTRPCSPDQVTATRC